MKVLHSITWVLIIIGALNWGIIGLFEYNLVMKLVGAWPTLEKLVYILVGLSAIYEIFAHPKNCKFCKPNTAEPM